MQHEAIRSARPDDAAAVAAIFAPIVRDTAISFDWEPPSARQMRGRIVKTLATHPWLVSVDEAGVVDGYAYAGPKPILGQQQHDQRRVADRGAERNQQP